MGGVIRSPNEKRLLGGIWQVLRNESPIGASKIHLLTTTALCCHYCELEMKANTAFYCFYIAQVLDVIPPEFMVCAGHLIQKL